MIWQSLFFSLPFCFLKEAKRMTRKKPFFPKSKPYEYIKFVFVSRAPLLLLKNSTKTKLISIENNWSS